MPFGSICTLPLLVDVVTLCVFTSKFAPKALVQVKPPVSPDCADKKYPLTGLLLTFNLASLTASDVNLASVTVLSLGVPIAVAEPIKVTNKLDPLGGAVQNLIPSEPSK